MPTEQDVIRAVAEFSQQAAPSNPEMEARYASNDAGGGLFMYWKKPDDCGEPGYIFIDGAHAVEIAELSKRGNTPLWKYGQFHDFEKDEKWDMRRDPWRRIFERGGATEFPLAQILEQKWHHTPPRKGVTFPQLEGVTVEEHKCNYCKRTFLSLDDLQKHETIRHTTAADQTQLARHLASATTGGLKDVMAQQQELQRQMIEAQQQMATAVAALAALAQQGRVAPVAPELVAAPAPAPAAPAAKAHK